MCWKSRTTINNLWFADDIDCLTGNFHTSLSALGQRNRLRHEDHHTAWRPEYDMEIRIRHGDQNTAWRSAYDTAIRIRHGDQHMTWISEYSMEISIEIQN